MHGLHDVDQKETIIGFPTSSKDFVSKVSPFEFSTFTDGTCANARADIKSDIANNIALI